MPPDEPAAPTTETAAAPAQAAETAAPSANESLSDKMLRLGWEKDAKHDAVPESLGAKARAAAAAPKQEEDEPTKPDVPKPKQPEPAPTDDPLAPKREQLKALVAELGMQMEDGKVTVAERAALREERRLARESLAKLEREAMGRIEAATKAAEERDAKNAPRLDKLSSFERAVEEGDHEAMAKLAGFESYDKLQEHIIALKADPAYKRLRAVEERAERIERETREREEAARKASEEETARQTAAQQQREQAETRSAYMKQLSAQMAASADPVVKAMADDPSFVGAVFRVQQDHWDGEQTLTPEQAIRTAARGAAQPLYAELKKLYDRISPIFGAPPAPAAAEKPATPPAKKPRSPEPISKPSPSAKKLDDREWKQQAARRLEEAVALERRANGMR